MGQKLPRGVSGKQVRLILCNVFGFVQKRKKGSHVVLRKESCVVIVPEHKSLKIGTLKGILRQARINKAEVYNYTQFIQVARKLLKKKIAPIKLGLTLKYSPKETASR